MTTRRFGRAVVSGVETWIAVQGAEAFPLAAPPWIDDRQVGAAIALADLRLLAPATPSKIVAIGRNYRAHAQELGNTAPLEPLLFLKPPSAIVGPDDDIHLPAQSRQVEHEGEMAIVIGRTAHHVPAARAMDHVFGLTCANDVTARDLQRADGQWTRAKGFDTFCPLGPLLVTGLDPSDRTVIASVNGAERQRGHTSALLFPAAQLVAYVSSVMTLLPGDLILTGTPAGVSRLSAGDRVEIEIDGIGTLSNSVTSGTVPTEG